MFIAIKIRLEPANEEDNQKVKEVSESCDLAEQLGEAFDDAAFNADLLAQVYPYRKGTIVLSR